MAYVHCVARTCCGVSWLRGISKDLWSVVMAVSHAQSMRDPSTLSIVRTIVWMMYDLVMDDVAVMLHS